MLEKLEVLNKKVYCLDTNIVLDNVDNIIKLSDNSNNKIIIPEVVIDELDAKKTGFDDINYNARQFARLLEESEIIKNELKGDLRIITTKIESLDIEIHIVSKTTYKCEKSNIALNILNDRKIIEVASDYSKIEDIVFLSLDIMARTRALSIGLKTESLKGKDKDLAYNFHKTIEIENAHMYDSKKITDLDPNYEVDNFSYTVIDSITGKPYMGQVENGHLYYFDDSAFKQKVKPINKEQKFFVKSILSGYADIIMCDAKAGSGKTLLALASAMELVKQKKYSGILYIRNSIESTDKGEEVGFLPGLEEKFKIYNHPLYDSLMFIAKSEMKKSNSNKAIADKIDDNTLQEAVDNLKQKYNIQTCWTGEMRGRTFSDLIVIMDEVQNMGGSTGQLVLTRLDKGCKCIVIGSNKQIDNMYTNKYVNSLSTLLKATKEEHNINLFACELNTVVRGPITEFAEKVFSSK